MSNIEYPANLSNAFHILQQEFGLCQYEESKGNTEDDLPTLREEAVHDSEDGDEDEDVDVVVMLPV